MLKPEIYDKLQAMEKGGIIRIKVLREESVNHNLENPVKAYLDYIPPDDVQAAVKASQPSKVQAESDGV